MGVSHCHLFFVVCYPSFRDTGMPTMGFVITHLEEAEAYCMTKDGRMDGWH